MDENKLVEALRAARILVWKVHDALDDAPELALDELNFGVDTGALLRQIDEALS